MNSGRTKYTSTPTYGMQKRWFGKRQTEKQPDSELDFTQKPTLDFDAPVSVKTDPYMMPQGIYHNPVPQQNGTPFQAYPAPALNGIGSVPFPAQNTGVQGGYAMNAPGYNTPFTGAPLPQMPPLANAPAAQQPMNGNGRTQGYVPPSVIPAEQTAVPGMQQNAAAQGMAYPQYGQPLFAAQQPGKKQNGAMGGYPGYAGGGQPPEQPPVWKDKPPVNIDNWLKMLLYIILPLVFVLCIALRDQGFNILRYLFLTACAASVGMLWYRQAFTSSLRTGVTIGYGLMCMVVIVMMLTGSNSDTTRTGANITPQPTPTITEEPSGAALGYQADQAPSTTAPVETAPGDTEEGLRLAAFMDNWANNDIEAMLSYVMPSWRSTKTDPATSLFIIIANRTPLDYEIESVSGTSGDTSRSITMTASIDKNNGNDPVRYRFIILVDKEDGNWYVDPNSLSTNDVDTTEETIAPDNVAAIYTRQPRMTVTPVPPPSTLLYYNPNGGKYYHADPECSSVNEKYLPMASFTYGELNESPYNSLLPCLKCNAPTN
ncbi:MAG: hypothetical protein JW811_04370 [Clostridiales bacterium]|nr:hypothetical protein [Clostridiales bacterium]